MAEISVVCGMTANTGPAAARTGAGAGAVAARGGTAVRAGRELDQPAPAPAVGPARCGVGGGAWRHAVELGGQPGRGAVGARQHRACRAPVGGVDRDAADDPGVAVLVRTLSAGRARRPRAHGEPTAPVPRRRAGEPGAPCRRAPARRPRRRVHQRSALPRGGDHTSAQACRHATPGAAAADRGSAAPAGGDRRPDDRA
jgi:hypothetical protein